MGISGAFYQWHLSNQLEKKRQEAPSCCVAEIADICSLADNNVWHLFPVLFFLDTLVDLSLYSLSDILSAN